MVKTIVWDSESRSWLNEDSIKWLSEMSNTITGRTIILQGDFHLSETEEPAGIYAYLQRYANEAVRKEFRYEWNSMLFPPAYECSYCSDTHFIKHFEIAPGGQITTVKSNCSECNINGTFKQGEE